MKKKILVTLILLLSFHLFLTAGEQDKGKGILGFSQKRAVEQRALEEKIQAVVSPLVNRQILNKLSSRVNIAGTPGDRKNAEFYRDYLNSLGFKAKIYSYFVYLPYPKDNYITIRNPLPSNAIFPGERGYGPADKNMGKVPRPYNAYSASGRVEGKVVYCNFASPEDFDYLEKVGVDVKGKIVIARYGRLYRGSKVFEAEKRGAVGILLYSDPINDGYHCGDVYPEGPMRPGDAVQRGSIYYMFKTPGDPLTPMKPAHKFADRIKPEEASLPGIPCIPLGYDDAALILKPMKGRDVPQVWQGALPFRYHIDSEDVTVTMNVEMDYQIREIWDVIGILEGTENPDQWVMVGCHRDAWVYGTADPHSGNSVILEAARAISEVSRKEGGLKRSVVVCSWDAEEFGVIGSVEWVEEMQDKLKTNAVVYMNADGIISGSRFGSSALPTVRPALNQVFKEVVNHNGVTYFDAWKAENKNRVNAKSYIFGTMGGGGSDHTGFVHHVGVTCMSAGSWGLAVFIIPLMILYWMDTFGDPGYKYHSSISRLMAVVLTRFANADVIPLVPSMYADELKKFHANLEKNIDSKHHEKLSGMEKLYDEIAEKGAAFEKHLFSVTSDGVLTKQQTQEINKIFMGLERSFLSESALPGMPWNRNLLYSPNTENGYGMVTFPGLISTHDDEDAFIIEVRRIEKCLEQYLDAINRAHAVLQ